MKEPKFTKWVKWVDRTSLSEAECPGVYCIAKSEFDLSGQDFDCIKEIEYIGMTNSQKLKTRLYQFNSNLLGKDTHGGADRCLYACQKQGLSYQELLPQLFVSVYPFECKIKSNNPEDLRVKGDIAKFEFYCIADYFEIFDELPKFNDKKNNPKYHTANKKLKNLLIKN